MKSLRDNIQTAFRALLQNWLRSALTMTGIIIGVLSIVTLVAILQGVKAEIAKQVEGLGANLVVVLPSKLDKNGRANPMEMFGISSLTEKDYEALKRVPGVAQISPVMLITGKIEREKQESSAVVVATNRDGVVMNPTPLVAGRYFEVAEENQNVCVLSQDPCRELFGNASAVGQTVRILGQNWKVVGVIGKPESDGVHTTDVLALDQICYLPVTAARRLFPKSQINRIVLKTDYRHPADDMVTALNATLLKTHEGKENFGVLTQKRALALVIKLLNMAQALLALIAAISLCVAGVGIMNIMLVTVTERTREIGVRKTVGARRADIFQQFLTEAIILSLLGGGIGLGISQVLCSLIARFSPLTPIITTRDVVMALAVCVCVGLLFGVAPAMRAARLNPIDALRYE